MSSKESSDISEALSYRPVEPADLELLLGWRSNPLVYEHFRSQDEPLDWGSHLSWFGSRSEERRDYLIQYQGRGVGSVFLTPDSFVGVYIGEVDLWGEGIGEAAVSWVCDKHEREAFFAEIHEDNEASRRLFEECGFTHQDSDDEWQIFARKD